MSRICLLCADGDRIELRETVAAAMWEARRHGTADDRPWPEAGPYWQNVFRELAEDAMAALEPGG